MREFEISRQPTEIESIIKSLVEEQISLSSFFEGKPQGVIDSSQNLLEKFVHQLISFPGVKDRSFDAVLEETGIGDSITQVARSWREMYEVNVSSAARSLRHSVSKVYITHALGYESVADYLKVRKLSRREYVGEEGAQRRTSHVDPPQQRRKMRAGREVYPPNSAP